MLTLIRNVRLYDPLPLGRRDILVCGERIAAVAPDLRVEAPDLEVLDAGGAVAVPGLLDQHVHIIGGGGENGLLSRIEPLPVAECVAAGITTVVGLLGTDSVTRGVPALVAYTKAMNEAGLTAFCLTGAYAFPSPTITGSVEKDIVYIQEVIGVKIAISDHRSSYITMDEILRLASQARVGGLVSNKAGITHFHVGREKKGLQDLIRIAETTDFPISHLKPTHVGNRKEDAFRFAALGGSIDFTAGRDPEETASQVAAALEAVPAERITVSSDANGSLPVWDENRKLVGIRKAEISALPETLRALVGKKKLPLERVLPLFTSNVAEGLKLFPRKGCLRRGADADLVLMDPSLKPQAVFARGKRLL